MKIIIMFLISRTRPYVESYILYSTETYGDFVRNDYKLLSARSLRHCLQSLGIFENIFLVLASVYQHRKCLDRYLKTIRKRKSRQLRQVRAVRNMQKSSFKIHVPD